MEETRVTARPQLYIDLIIDGRRQVFEPKIADLVVRELTLALNQLDQQFQAAEGVVETNQSRRQLKGADQVPESGDVKRVVAGVGSRPSV